MGGASVGVVDVGSALVGGASPGTCGSDAKRFLCFSYLRCHPKTLSGISDHAYLIAVSSPCRLEMSSLFCSGNDFWHEKQQNGHFVIINPNLI